MGGRECICLGVESETHELLVQLDVMDYVPTLHGGKVQIMSGEASDMIHNSSASRLRTGR